MHETKAKLIELNGLRCMLCGKEYPYREINWHHIKPKYVSKYLGEPQDNSYDNGSLLCLNCHAYVHTFSYWSYEYQHLMFEIRNNKKDTS